MPTYTYDDASLQYDTFITTFDGGVTSHIHGKEIQYHLNRIAGTLDANGRPTLDEEGAANVWAGTSEKPVQACLNVVAGLTGMNRKDLQGVANIIAGTVGLGVADALSRVPIKV